MSEPLNIDAIEAYFASIGQEIPTAALVTTRRLIARVRELERGEQHHANIIDRLHAKNDELKAENERLRFELTDPRRLAERSFTGLTFVKPDGTRVRTEEE